MDVGVNKKLTNPKQREGTMQKMLRFSLLVISISVMGKMGWGQIWNYNFGTSTDIYDTNNSSSTTFLPSPENNGGTARVRMSNNQGGSFNLENPGLSDFGSETELRIVASTGNSVNKFSVYDYTSGNTFTIKFSMRFGGGSSGYWYLFIGDGVCFSNNDLFTKEQIFLGIKWMFGESSTITTTYYKGSSQSWIKGSLINTPFYQDINYTVEILGNNSTDTINYNYNGSQSLLMNSWDLWVNGILVGDNLEKGLLNDNSNIDSWMFYGGSSSGNVANIYLDNIYYTNSIYTDGSLPVELQDFSANLSGNLVLLTWTTASEIENQGFNIYRKLLSDEYYLLAGFLNDPALKGFGSTSESHTYHCTDKSAQPGATYTYLLSDVNYAGLEKKHYDHEVIVTIPEVAPAIAGKFKLEPIYPNPFNQSFTIPLTLPKSQLIKIVLYDSRGQVAQSLDNQTLPAGAYKLNYTIGDLSSGIYFVRINAGKHHELHKVILIK